ncbi:HK97 gp10 family phage protein [Rothia sp. AR01]|uniref:HK97 gp10 family phage protein n=1 Tax=Rothia santali TaxID=2949643 RepID=A0A9X2KIH5_9MICC|nr:HK97-gp10 family putative phage morphogenesis protein [Rothia santali]MCP3426025.1 HK97 gp10 family phage protein [Rothia santali]
MATDSTELAELAGDLRAGAARVERAVHAATVKAGADLQAQAQRRAPVDTGYLRASIAAESPAPGEVLVGPGAHYGIYLEYGTSRMAARPYMTPAFDVVAPAYERAIAQAGEALL